MLFDDFCLKIYFWPFLSYLANIKGFCPYGLYPPGYFPVITLPPGTILTTPPTVIPTFQPTPPLPTVPPTTLPPCPAVPLVCLAGGVRPIPYCPCIDPRQNGQNLQSGQIGQTGQSAQLLMLPPAYFSHHMTKLGPVMQIFVMLIHAQNCRDSRSRPGNCVALTACPSLIEEFYAGSGLGSSNADFHSYVSESICGFDGTNFLVCCAIRRAIASMVYSTRLPYNMRPTPPSFSLTTRPPVYELPLQSIFHFSPLSGGSGNTGGNNGAVQYPATSPPVIFQSPVISQSTVASVTLPPQQQQPQQPQQTLQPLPPQPSTPTSFQPIPGVSTMYPTPLAPQQPASGTVTRTCGISRGTINRVVGGAEARRGTYPWIAALGYRDEFDKNSLKFLCAGSLVSSTYVVTSAHCINPTLTLVRLGAHDLSLPAEPDSMDFRIRRSIVHENFDLQSIANDIALIELSSAAPNTNYIGTICLPESSYFLNQDFVGMNPFVAGWGAIKHQGPTSQVLRDVQVPIVSRQVCEQSYRSVFKFIEFSERLLCAGNVNVDACQGDSGGPLMMPQMDGSNYRFYLLGIVSYGYECARSGFPGVYTRVASYVPWIRRHIG